MNYSLTSSRKIGKCFQSITTSHSGAAKATTTAELTALKSWHTAFADLDATGRTVETIRYKNFSEAESDISDNQGARADVTFTVLSDVTTVPTTTVASVKNVTVTNMITQITAAYFALTGQYITNINTYLIGALITLHNA